MQLQVRHSNTYVRLGHITSWSKRWYS